MTPLRLALLACAVACSAPASGVREVTTTSTASVAAPRVKPAAPAPDPKRVQLREALDRSAEFLAGSVEADGRFIYRINLDPHVDVKPSYNLLRHAGSIYALASYHARWPTPRVEKAIVRSTKWLASQLHPVEGEEGAIALWESPARDEAKLGGAGLALVAFASAAKWAPVDRATVAGVGRFIAFLQKDDGGFYSKFYRDERGRSDAWTSLYYPGEAALGLLMLHELAPDSAHRDVAVRALGYLATLRKGQRHVEPDHWALIATGRLFAEHAASKAEWPVDENTLRVHAKQVCESILLEEQDLAEDSEVRGAWDHAGNTTPIATRLEGLLAALPLMKDDADLDERMRIAIAAGVELLLRVQVKEGPFAGAVPRAVRGPRGRATEVRIDYVQHAMSAWLGYYDLLGS
jgi:hypothetical protein